MSVVKDPYFISEDLMEQTRDWIQLSLVPGLGPIGFWALVDHFGSPRAVLAASTDDWRWVRGLRPVQIDSLTGSGCLAAAADDEMQKLEALGGRVLAWPDSDYPPSLRRLACPPPVLYTRGLIVPLSSRPAVALVGSRAATSYGRRTAYTLARDLAGRGVSVVSGLAQGIDTEAHAGCLAGNGYTIGVLGCGLDVVYPRSNGDMYRRVSESGLLISEYPLGTRPDAFRFPARNRIIAGLSRGVVVVEAAKRSGSMITVQHALEEGREVFAVPGQIDSAKSAGSHWLLQQGASLVVCADDIVEGLGLSSVRNREPPPAKKCSTEPATDTGMVYALLEPYPQARDELLRLSGLSSARLSEILLLLELDGVIELLPGDRLRRLD